LGVLIFIIILDIVVMAIILRLVTTEPPHKHPSTHPLVMQYARKPENPAPLIAEQSAPPAEEPAPVAEAPAPSDEDDGKTELGE
jgi:hypothetical protein